MDNNEVMTDIESKIGDRQGGRDEIFSSKDSQKKKKGWSKNTMKLM